MRNKGRKDRKDGIRNSKGEGGNNDKERKDRTDEDGIRNSKGEVEMEL